MGPSSYSLKVEYVSFKREMVTSLETGILNSASDSTVS